MIKNEIIQNRSGKIFLPRCSLLGLRLWFVTVGHRAGQQTTAADRDSLLEAQRMMTRLHGRWHMRRRMWMLQNMAGYRSWHVGQSTRCHAMRSVSRRGIQLGEVDVGRFQLQGRWLVRRRRQSATLASSRDQHRIAMLMRMMAMVTRTTTAYRTRAPRTLLQTRRAIMATTFDSVNRTWRPGRTRRRAPWT